MIKKGDWINFGTSSGTCYKVHSVHKGCIWIIFNNKKYKETSWFAWTVEKVKDFSKYTKHKCNKIPRIFK